MTTMTRKKTRSRKAVSVKLKRRHPKLSSIDPSKMTEHKRFGVKQQDHLMMVGFRHPNATPEVIDGVRDLYRRRWFSQRSLAEMFEISVSLVAKIVRTDPFWRS